MTHLERFINNVTPLDAKHLNELVNTLNTLIDKIEASQIDIGNLNDEIQNIDTLRTQLNTIKNIVDEHMESCSGGEIEFRVANGYIQWRYKGEESWNNLISMDILKGANGDKGERGEKGEAGITPNITIGTITTLEAGQQATVVNSGTKENPIFNFGIPRGENGDNSSGSNNASIDDNTISTEKTWSSFKTEEFVLNNVGAIWQEINGGQMTIDSTMDGFLREIEILGNTMQNQSVLSDIQHLGVWNEVQQGYEIDIITTNQMFVYEQKPVDASPESDSLIITPIYNGWNIKSKKRGAYQCACVKLKNLTPNTTYRLKAKAKNYNNTQIDIYMNSGVYYEFKNETTNDININKTFIPAQKEVNLYLYITKNSGEGNVDFTDFILVKDKNDVENLDIHKTTLLLPYQLMKIGNASDRLYWDSSKGRYVIEKNILKFLAKYVTRGFSEDNVYIWLYRINDIGARDLKIIVDSDIYIGHRDSDWVNLKVNKDFYYRNGYQLTEDDINRFLKDYPVNIICAAYSSGNELIETNITEEIKLPTFMNNTYITVNGGIEGSIKAKAPVDGGKVIGVLQEENIKLKEINDVQDELINTTMLATDEMYMMLEPLLVNMFNDSKSINPLVNMYVAMINRGLKTMEHVPERYREQVKKIIDQSETELFI